VNHSTVYGCILTGQQYRESTDGAEFVHKCGNTAWLLYIMRWLLGDVWSFRWKSSTELHCNWRRQLGCWQLHWK